MLIPDKDLVSPLTLERTRTPGTLEELVKVWGECSKLWKTLSHVWLALAFGFLLFGSHIVFSHLLVGA